MKKISLLVILILLISVTAACSGKTGPASQTEGTDFGSLQDTEAKETKILPDLPEKDFQGAQVMFLVREFDGNGYWGSQEIYSEKETGEPINDAVYRRNCAVEDRFNIKIAEIRTNDVGGKAKQAIMANDHAYDVIMGDLGTNAYLATQGLLLDLHTLPYVNLSQPWYDQRANGQLSVFNKLYLTTGELNIIDNDATWVIMFNKKVAQDHNLPDLYDLVYQNQWILDKFWEVVQLVSNDLDGNGKYDENDQYGLLTDSGWYNIAFYNMGESCAVKNAEDLPVIALNSATAPTVAEKIIEIGNNKENTLLADSLTKIPNPWTDGVNKIFQENRGLFYTISLTVMHKMRNMESDFGVLPYPRFTEAQTEYHHTVQPIGTSIGVPITTVDTEKTGIALEALSAESMYTLTPAYYDVTITNKTMRDEDSAKMLDLIFSTRKYDLGYIFNWGGMGYFVQNLKNNPGNFASSYAKSETSVLRAMEKTIEEFGKLN